MSIQEKHGHKKSGIVICFMLMFLLSGCRLPFSAEIEALIPDTRREGQAVTDICLDLYEKAAGKNQMADLEMVRSIVSRFGENGYCAVDSRNQIDMTEADQAVWFCTMAEMEKEAELTIVEVTYSGGFVKYELRAEDGNVDVVRSYYIYENGHMEKKAESSCQAEAWHYTEDGYIMFSGSYFSEELYIITVGGTKEYAAFRVQPLDETCRELNRQYLLPVGYMQNNMFLVDWSEEDYGELNFYDVYDLFYPKVYGQPVPYTADDNLGAGAIYEIPEDAFENVIMTYFKIDKKTLQARTVYDSEDAAYAYRPRGFYEIEYPAYPYPEVVAFRENSDGTLALTVNVVFPYGCDSKVYVHEVVVRPLESGGVQYVSNRLLSDGNEVEKTWHTPRLTGEEWEEMYGGRK